MRNKRSSFVINLIETPNGFSLIEGTQILNKPAVNIQKAAPPPPAPPIAITNPTISINTYPKQIKNVYKKINLIFPKGNINQRQTINFKKDVDEQEGKIQEQNQINISKISNIGDFIEWFDMEKVHQKQISQIRLWYAQENLNEEIMSMSIGQNKKLSKYIQTYKKHRNIIITLYYKEHFHNGTYLTVSQVRKRIPCDAYWLMRIHIYLCNNFIINFNTLDYDHQIGSHQYLYKLNLQSGKYEMLRNQLNMMIQSDLKMKKMPQTPEEQNQALKLITNKIRPYCDYCGIHCGIVWFHHFKQVDSKQLSVIMKNVNSKNPPLSQKPYQMILCTRCYCDGNFPILLTHHDFKKMTVNDKLQPNKNKKLKKKKKDKKRKQKEREQQQRMQQKQQEYYQEEPQQKYEQQQKNEQQKEAEEKHKEQIIEKQERQKEDEQPKEQINVGKMIQNILNSYERPKARTLEETLRLIELVQEYEDDWQTIKSQLQTKGYFMDCGILDLINFFVSLPKRNVSKLKYQYQPEQFLMQNYKSNKNSVSDLIAQRTLNRAINLEKKVKASQIKTEFQWKQNLNRLINQEMQKITNRVQHLQSCQEVSKQLIRKTIKISQNCRPKN